MNIYITNYHFEHDRNKHQVEHQTGLKLLCYGLENLYHLSFSETEIEEELIKGEHGKPYLKSFPQIHFNISHSYGIAVCVLSDCEMGIDIEKITPFRAAVLSRVLTEKEQKFLQTFDEKEQEEMFYRFWTLKESYLKLDGSGLARDMREVSFSMEKQEDGWKCSCSDGRVSCTQKKIKEEYMLALCSSKNRDVEEIHVTWISTQDVDENGEVR